jgi:parallel beta-helix repeat protein
MYIKILIRLSVVSCIVLISLISFAKTYHVSNSGSDSYTGESYVNAFQTIQKATDLVVAGDSVRVYDGYYKGFNHKDKNSGTSKDPIVYYTNGANVIINQGSSIGDGINIENNDYIMVIGFKVYKIPNNPGIAGGEEGIRAVYANYITIRDCIVDSCFRGIFTGYSDHITIENNICTRSYGEHGIYVSNNSDYIVLRYNSSGYNKASGIQINPDLSSGNPGFSVNIICTHNTIYENKGAAGLNFQGLDSALIANNLIYNNHNASGITLFHGDASKGCTNIKVYNNTIFVPSDGRWGIHIIDDAANIRIHNNIIINQHQWKGAIALQPNSYTQTEIISNYNLVTGRFCETSDGCSKTLAEWQSLGFDLNSIQAPASPESIFISYATLNFHLVAGSPAINTGTSFVSTDVKDDLDNFPRPFASVYDMGCFESHEGTGFKSDDPVESCYKLVIGNLVYISNLDSSEKVSFYNLSGKLISDHNYFPAEMLQSGMYFYKIIPQQDPGKPVFGKFSICR